MTDVNTVPKPIVVSTSQGTLDSLSALGRQLILVVGGFSTLATLLGERNVQGILDFLQSADGIKWATAAITVGALAWGQIKTWRRGAQLSTVAASSRVPDSVAQIKE
jgi:hypothetical protein